MNHIPYEIAVMRRDDLLRAPVKRRLASQSTTFAEGEPSATPIRRLRALWQLRFAGRGGASQTYGERTLDGRL